MLSFTCSDSKIQSVPAEYRNMSNLKYSWYRNNILIANVTKQLTIDSLSKLDNQAQYRCAVREDNSSFTEVDSETVTLDVAYTDSVNIQTARIGLSEVFSCTSDCYPECSHRWLDDGGRVLSDASRLEPSKETSGSRVTCEASNDYGKLAISSLVFYDERRTFVMIIALSSILGLIGLLVIVTLVFIVRARGRALNESQELPIYAVAFEGSVEQQQQQQQQSRFGTSSQHDYRAERTDAAQRGVMREKSATNPFTLAAYMRMSDVKEVYTNI